MPIMLKYRLILGPIMITLLLGVLWLDQWVAGQGHLRAGVVMLLLFMLPIIYFGSKELAVMLRGKGVQIGHPVLFIAGSAGCLGVFALMQKDLDLPGPEAMLLVSLAALVLTLAVLVHIRHKQTDGATLAIAAALFCFVYLGLMGGTLVAVRIQHSAWVLAAVLLITKSCDIGAYFTGRAIGKHKLIPWLSPGKTWEGLIGGVAFAAGVSALALTPASMASLHWGYALIVGVVLALVGQAGDLLASLFKRDAAIKDSGSSLPGFGGVLDVADSPLLSVPVAYWLLALA